ncbi:circadian clock protein KaiC [Palleronia aestuarii]|uniref:non-specific serine/threonine protein kinase n=1 Tax=Palleronia aestuarii TaxID=568105 RepID=A0A2W7PKL0_9RHOB|nr:ATPase domain-containing protein [Palleronia aestuarii]PZX09829.1 circadian clock protein KaiC [Palleronia aestuarii]
MPDRDDARLLATGVPGLDTVLKGGLPPRGLYFVGGAPGTGKTTLGLQFLLEGRRLGEETLFISLSQDRRDLERIAKSHDFDLSGIRTEEISAVGFAQAAEDRQTVIETADTELSSAATALQALVVNSGAQRVVIDSLFEVRLLAHDPLSYRRQLLLLRENVARLGATALVLDYIDDTIGDRQLEGLVNGAILLEQEIPGYGASIRRLHVGKVRGQPFVEGYHNLTIRKGGLTVFPRVVPKDATDMLTDEVVVCGIDGLDHMMGGGLALGTTCLVAGHSGTGKSTVCTAYASAAARAGRTAAMFLFEERTAIFRRRSQDLGFDLQEMEEAGSLILRHFDPAEMSPGEFMQIVVETVERNGVQVVAIDSLSGFLGAHPSGTDLIVQLHSLLTYLSRRNVLTFVTLTHNGLLDDGNQSGVDTSYLADSALLLRNEDMGGDLRRTITVVKKRHGDHEQSVRELVIGDRNVDVVPSRTGVPPHLAVV